MTKFALTTSEWIKLAKKTHKNRYAYHKAVYINASTKIQIICDKHGLFWQLPRKHVRGSQCPKCAREHANDYRKMDRNEFIEQCQLTHKHKYDYSKVSLHNLNSRITIICPKHGEFEQRAYSHLKGHGCKKCLSGSYRTTKKTTYNTTWFINRSYATHGDKYDYSMVTYEGSARTVSIICKTHGIFYQVARDHINGYGCPQCGLTHLSEANRMSTSEFLKRANEVHCGRYDYSDINYKNQSFSIIINCPQHGRFRQNPKHHLRGQGCPRCKISVGHSLLCSLLDSYNIHYFINDRNILDPLEIDIYIPSKRLGIEYHGIYWHSFDRMESVRQRLRHWDKANIAANNNIILLQIFEHELHRSKPIIASIIQNKLGLSRRIGARSLDLYELNNDEATKFYDANHLYGYRPSLTHIGLRGGDDVLACMSFSRCGDGFELMRYACRIGYNVVGGPSRLFKKFVDSHSPIFVRSYADRRFSLGGMYERLGFVIDTITKPNYYYVLGSDVYSRQQFQKHKLHHKLENFDPELSESANMFMNNYRRLWDAGHYKYVWRPK